MSDLDNEFVLSVIIRKRADALHPVTSTEAVKMVREVLEREGGLDIVGVVGRQRYTSLPDGTSQPV